MRADAALLIKDRFIGNDEVPNKRAQEVDGPSRLVQDDSAVQSAYATGKLDVALHDGHPLGVDGAQIATNRSDK